MVLLDPSPVPWNLARVPRPQSPPPGAVTSAIDYRVPFYDTDAMRIVHHANFVRYLELARLRFLEEHLQPYSAFVAQGLHFAVTRCEVDFLSPARFDDALVIRCWLTWARGASLGIAYRVERDGALLAGAATEHAMVDDAGRPMRIPTAQREALLALVTPA
jgi:acyl-CoA thioester hydrolase